MSFNDSTPQYTVTATCPQCRGPLRLRQRRDGSGAFLGCEHYPGCRYTAPYDQAIDALAKRLHAAEKGIPAHSVSRAALDRALKHLIAVAHPDRWADHPAATELSKLANDIRARVREGRL
jgi:ssDNA-binding Zn-finger/Zn-ribbon topoisomerase 1